MADHKEKPKIIWDESGIHHSRVNACAIRGSREEISLLFGTEGKDHPSEVRLTNRVILNPFTAKQLLTALSQIIRDYETKIGPLKEKKREPTAEERKLKASSLFQTVKGLDVSIGYEQSFKIYDQSLLSNRFLLGISKKAIEHQAHDRIVRICERMGMPHRFMDIFKECLFDANYVHFGFEESKTSCIYKVYVEFWDEIKEEMNKKRDAASQPHLLHLGFKWDPFDPEKKAITRYTWHPWLTGEEIIKRIGDMVDPGKHGHILEGAEALIKTSLERMPFHDILYLEVTEEDNPRKSFDINVYRGDLLIGETYRLLTLLGQYYSIPHKEFHDLYDRIKMQRFGHLAGGVDREGRDFCTIYYGVEPIQRSQNVPPETIGSHFYFSKPPYNRPSRHIQMIETADKQAGHLLKLVKNLEVPFGFERSMKMTHKSFLPERFLLGFHRKDVDGAKREGVLDICRQINMPDDFLLLFQSHIDAANMVLFGFERDEKSRLHKVYLEFKDRFEEAVADHPSHPKPFEMYVGYKWNISDPSQKVITRYTCFPSFVLRDMADEASRLLFGHSAESPYRIVEGILDLASHRAGPNEFVYLEVTEKDNIRRSFDINVYKPGLQVAEIYPWLSDMAKHYKTDSPYFNEWYESAKMHVLGHVAGGIDRGGRDFLTLYYSEKNSMRIIA